MKEPNTGRKKRVVDGSTTRFGLEHESFFDGDLDGVSDHLIQIQSLIKERLSFTSSRPKCFGKQQGCRDSGRRLQGLVVLPLCNRECDWVAPDPYELPRRYA